MRRFYFPQSLSQSIIAITDPDEIYHLTHVVRMKVGDEIELFNGQGQAAIVSLQTLSTASVTAKVVRLLQQPSVAHVRLILACAVPKKAKFEFIIEKATELGVDEIVPLKTKRTEVEIKPDRAAGKQERFKKIVINAAKQCGRQDLPRVHAMTSLKDVFKLLPQGSVKLFPSLHNHPSQIKDVLSQNEKATCVVIFIGPEGDFTPDEVKLAIDYGCVPVTLGQTVLKVDTAAISCLSYVKYFYGQ